MSYETKDDPLEAAFAAHVPDTGAELQALRRDMAQLQARLVSRPALAGSKAEPVRTAFADRYLRQGLEPGGEVKALTIGVGSEGGVAVPVEIDALIDKTLASISPIRSIANVVPTGSANYRKLIARGGFASGWVAETAARPVTANADFVEIAPPTGELYANPAATQPMLDDAAFDVETWLAEEIAAEFARAEGVAFVTGTGTAQPRGFLTYATTAALDATRPFGTLQHVATGVAGNFAAANPQDRLVDLVHALRAPYRQGASFVMNSATLARIRKFKDADGGFIWSPGLMAGQPATLLGYPVIEAEAMPDVAADSLSIAFGDFRAGYVIADRMATAVLRDPYSNKPYVHFYATRRVGGAVVNSEAIKVMKFSVN